MLEPEGLYELTGEGAEQLAETSAGGQQPVLVQALTGFVDAGGATELVREHLLADADGDSQLVASFDVDQLLDYRSRRPTMIFVEDHWEEYEEPSLGLHLLRDQAGTSFLLLAGPEPDLHWERFIVAATGLVERFNVRLTVGLNAIPMAVPHTRPIGITAHATQRDLIAGYEPWLRKVQVPGSAGNLLEYRLGQRGHAAMGFAVHVPHYLSQTPYPDAAEALVSAVARATDLRLPTERLRAAAEVVRADVDRQVAQSDEAGELVRTLEEQYDALMRSRESSGSLADAGELPTADELGAELERFLAERTKRGDPPTP